MSWTARRRLSQRRRLSEDTVTDTVPESCTGDHVHVAAEGLSEVHEQTTEIEKASPGFEVDQDVDVAALVGIAAGHGSEHGNVGCAALRCDREQFVAAAAQLCEVGAVTHAAIVARAGAGVTSRPLSRAIRTGLGLS